jgi:DNA-binding SARP family transcriptional activator/tetratricopeptide (TPR) repeat protein
VECTFRILGPPEMSPDAHNVVIAPRLWSVFVSLLLTPNIAVSADVIIDRVWGESPSAQARTSLRSYVSRISRALSQAGHHEARIVPRSQGYALIVDSEAIDVHRFRSLKRQADAMADSGDRQHAALLLEQAEALWRGDALAGLPGEWIARMRASLEEERHAAALRRVELGLLLGRHVGMLGELSRLSGMYPYDETLIGYLMTALYRAGRPGDALRTYREARARLVEQGIEPGPDLAGLHQRVLRHDPALAITPEYRRPDQAARPNALPAGAQHFVGREQEIRQLLEEGAGQNSPLLHVIEGPAGIGKTALAVQAARQVMWRYPDAQIYLNLHAHDPAHHPLDAFDALHQLLRMLDLSHQRIPAELGARAALWRSELACRRTVIILDDVASPDQIGLLLPTEGDCLTIVTSRRRHPDWAGISTLALDVLPADDAVALFSRIAGPGPHRDREQIVSAVSLCGRLPLAIQVAASRIRYEAGFGLADLLDELADFAAARHRGDAMTRQLAAAFELSCRGLAQDHQRFFRCLGIAPTVDITVYTAMALTASTLTDAEVALGALQDHHLIEQPSSGRFQFHDLIRSYAALRCEKEDPEPERRRALTRLIDYYLCAIDQARRVIGGLDHEAARGGHRTAAMETPEAALDWLAREWRNILRVARHAARRERKRQCADLTHAIGEFLETSGYWSEAVSAHTLALESCREMDDLPGVARAAFDLSLPSLRTGHPEVALRHANEALVVCRSLGDSRGQVTALDRMGIIHRYSGRFRDALAYHQEAIDMGRLTGEKYGTAQALCHAGTTYLELGRYFEASEHFTQALDLYRQIGDRRGEAKTLNNIGNAQERLGLYRDAMNNYQAALGIFLEIGGRQSISLSRQNIGLIHCYKGNYEDALSEYREALATYRVMGDLKSEAYALCDIGDAYQGMECPSEALVHHEKAKAIAERIKDPLLQVTALCGIAEANRDSGRHALALEQYEKAITLARQIEAPYPEAKALQGTAETMLRTGRPEAARIYWRQALDIFRQLGVPEAETISFRLDTLR